MSVDFRTPIATWSCKTADCFFKTHSQEKADAHHEESGHRWFRLTGHIPPVMGWGFAA